MNDALQKFRSAIDSISAGKCFLLLTIFVVAVFCFGLNSRHLKGGDEPRVAGTAAEMMIYGDWVEPHLNGKPFLEKPPLYFWADALSIKAFGQNEFAAKLPSALAALLGVLALFRLVKAMGYSNFSALLSCIMLATSAQYWEAGRKCMIDIFLAAFILFAMWAFFELCRASKLKHKIWWYLFFVLMLGGAVFSKGLVGLAIPASALFFWLLLDDFWLQKKFRLSRWIWLFSGSALCFIPVAIWVWALYEKSGYDAVYTVVWTNNFGRFTGGHAEHIAPFWYYLTKLPEQFQPWAILLPFALYLHFRRVIKEKAPESLFMLCWLLIPYLLLTISAGKRQVYVLPLYAAEAILAGTLVAMLLEGKIKLPEKVNLSLILVIVSWILCAGLLISPVVFISFAAYFKLAAVAYIASATTLLAGVIVLSGLLRKRVGTVALGLMAGLAAVFVSVDTAAMSAFNYKHSYHPLFDYCQRQIDNGAELYLYRPIERISGGAIFYLGDRFKHYDNAKNLPAGKKVLVLADENRVEELNKAGLEQVKRFKIKRTLYWILEVKRKK